MNRLARASRPALPAFFVSTFASALASAQTATSTPAPGAPADVQVSGRRGPTVGSRMQEPLRDIPATVHVVTDREIEEHGASDVAGAVSWVPGVQPQLEYGGFTSMTIRGFKEFTSVVDGMRDDRYQLADSAPSGNLAGIDRIEVLKGPASALYGYGGIGGVVSILHKLPSRRFGYEGSLSVGGPSSLRRASVGATGPIDDTLAARVDAGIVDDEGFRRNRSTNANITGAVEWRPADRHRVLVRLGYQKFHFSADTGLPTENGKVPDGIALERRFNTPWDYLDGAFYDGRLEYAYTASDHVKLVARAGVSRNPYDYKSAEFLTVGRGQTVDRQWFTLGQEWDAVSAQLEAHVRGTLLVPHRALFGYDFGYLLARPPRFDLRNTDLAPVPFADAPDPQGDYGTTRVGRVTRHQTTHSLFAHDTVKLAEGFKLSLSGRLDRWEYDSTTRMYDTAVTPGGSQTSQDRDLIAATFRAGLVLQPADWLTFYGMTGTGFTPVRTVSADGRTFDPERGREYELGARIDAFERRMHVDLAAYNLRKTDMVVARKANIYEQLGAQSSRGVEASITLESIASFSLRLGYAYTRARYDDYLSSSGNFTGKTPANVPDHTFSAWGKYVFPLGFSAAAGLRVIGNQWADASNTVEMPAYALVSAAVFYAVGPMEIAVNGDNLLGLGRYYVSSINDSQLTPGPPRTVLVSLRYKSRS
ncbi:TonB-dependent receptor [Pendulispora albinea]|uniref:TonB-dependent receptor n=1 Tax=Pendulispora albinea TaxID=2741071 RepID=A0ABZ2M7N4_9BACT